MATIIKTSITVNKPVEIAWDAFMNPANLQHWLTGFVSSTNIQGKAGEIGSQNKVVFKERGKEIVFTERVILIIPMQHYQFEMEHESMNSENDMRFISFGDYTEIIQTVKPFPKSFLMKLLMPFIKGSLKKTMTKDLFNLKKIIEATNK